jgi:hypothetical protein
MRHFPELYIGFAFIDITVFAPAWPPDKILANSRKSRFSCKEKRPGFLRSRAKSLKPY